MGKADTNSSVRSTLLVFLAPKPRIRVRDSDAELLRSLDQSFPVLGRHTVGDFGAKLLVLHHEHLELLKCKEYIRNQTVY